MKFTILSSEKIHKLIEIFKVIKNLSSHCTLYCKEEYIYIQTMDGSHVCLLDIKIMKNWFDSYEIKECETVSFSSSIIVKILSLFIPKTKLVIQTTSRGDYLNIELIYPDNIEKTFEIPLMEIDQEYLETGENDYAIEFSMKTKLLDKYTNEMMLFGEILQLKCVNDNIYMSSGDQVNGNYKVKIPHENLEEFTVEEDLKMAVKVDLKYISFISKFYSVFKTINIKADSQYPMKFYVNESSSIVTKEGNDENALQLTYYIAPKMEDDVEFSDEEEDLDDISETNEIVDI